MTAADLKEARLRLGLSQTQMAEALATPVRTYQGWEADRYTIPGVVSLAVNCLSKHRSKSPAKNRTGPNNDRREGRENRAPHGGGVQTKTKTGVA